MPSAIGAVLAAPALIGSLVALRALLARTRDAYRIQLVNLPFGLLVILFFLGAEIHFTRQLFVDETYESFRTPFEGKPDPPSTSVFLIGATVAVLMGSAFLTAGTLKYVSTFIADTGRRFEKRAGEPDAVGQIMASRHTGE
jgi:hypothetical protein